MINERYQPKNKIRIVSSTSLFDGHDASINIMRRIMQSSGAELIHLGHNRSAEDIVNCAIQEDAHAIAITSYQGGHMEFFKYIHDLLKERGCDIKIVGGGGGTILPSEIDELHEYGVSKIFSPDDGRELGLQGMINQVLEIADYTKVDLPELVEMKVPKDLARNISLVEELNIPIKEKEGAEIPVIGITGTGGAGKSSLTDELILRMISCNNDIQIGVLSIDPTKKRSGGALLGDRIRMNSSFSSNVFMRSVATREANTSVSDNLADFMKLYKQYGFDVIILESSGIGQSDTAIIDYCDVSLYVMTPEYGASTQLEKIDMLDYADLIAVNKFEKVGAEDALHDVRKQYRRNRELWGIADEELPIIGTIASQFNNEGVDKLFNRLVLTVQSKFKSFSLKQLNEGSGTFSLGIIPPNRVNYLARIVQQHEDYKQFVSINKIGLSNLYSISKVLALDEGNASLLGKKEELESSVDTELLSKIIYWESFKKGYEADVLKYTVRDKELEMPLKNESLSGTKFSKVSLPKYSDWGDIGEWVLKENIPGEFPYTAGVFPLKRHGESATRMFAGEGSSEKTNRRFHYISKGRPAKRLSTAFDSVTLYGEDPAIRPDIYGKIGNSGVSIATLDEMKKLFSGFDLCDPKTSVSMTINGPAPILLSFFLNTAIDQQCEKYIQANGLESKLRKLKETKFGANPPKYNGELPEGNNGLGLLMLGVSGDEVLAADVYHKVKEETMSKVRGTVQADILKEDQAQNTCVFSINFAMHLMGDVQAYFVKNTIRNFYSISISGYHIAEAGANPISQLAFTLSNGFTYVEYFLSRGMHIDEFAHNLSFFFSNGVDPEYAVIGRVARRIWAKAVKYVYKGNERSQKLKYHIQTSGRSLHSSEIAFNDIRTTLQALYAVYDNCNSLHTNAYDEAITTPTEESVRRAIAIQLIIDQELGLAQNENPLQGSFIIEELTDLVEEAVYAEFQRISDRGGVMGAMERMYQRSKIQDESMLYERIKSTGEMPIIGVNTFLDDKGSPIVHPGEVVRSTEEERNAIINGLEEFKSINKNDSHKLRGSLQKVISKEGNIMDWLMEASKKCSLGEITHEFYKVGGEYRRNM